MGRVAQLGGGWGGVAGGGLQDTYTYFSYEETIIGTDRADSDPQYNFLNQFITNEEHDNLNFLNADMSPYSEFDLTCKYIGINDYIKPTCNLSILSLNIQSLSAKFAEFSDLINDLTSTNSQPDIICLQEIWQLHDTSLFNLPNYHPIEINLRNTAGGGGVGVYVHESLSFKTLPHCSIFVDRILETLFIEITLADNIKMVVGSVYRPGTKFPGLTFSSQFAQSRNYSPIHYLT